MDRIENPICEEYNTGVVDNKPRIHIALDIDQTLAGGVVPAHMGLYNDRLNLGMTHEEIAATSLFGKTFDVPQIIDARSRDEEAFQQVRAEIRTSEQVHLDFSELPGSVKAAHALLEHATVSYYSVRTTAVEGATKQWLKEKGFPNPEDVVICDSPEDKLKKISADHLEGTTDKTVVLIDDSYNDLAGAAQKIVEENPETRKQFERLILVGFGLNHEAVQMEETFYLKSGIRTVALPAWEEQHMLQLIQHLNSTN